MHITSKRLFTLAAVGKSVESSVYQKSSISGAILAEWTNCVMLPTTPTSSDASEIDFQLIFSYKSLK